MTRKYLPPLLLEIGQRYPLLHKEAWGLRLVLGLNPPDNKGKQGVHLSRTRNNSGERSTEHESRASVASAGFGKKKPLPLRVEVGS